MRYLTIILLLLIVSCKPQERKKIEFQTNEQRKRELIKKEFSGQMINQGLKNYRILENEEIINLDSLNYIVTNRVKVGKDTLTIKVAVIFPDKYATTLKMAHISTEK